LSRDKRFVEKLTDVVGLYLNPPDKALVLCVDEKSQIQALDRTQPGLPMKKGRCGTMTHDYKRNCGAKLKDATIHDTTTLHMSKFLLSDLNSNLRRLNIYAVNKGYIKLGDIGTKDEMRQYLENKGALFFNKGELVTKGTKAAKEYREPHKEDDLKNLPPAPTHSVPPPPSLPAAPSPEKQAESQALDEEISELKSFSNTIRNALDALFENQQKLRQAEQEKARLSAPPTPVATPVAPPAPPSQEPIILEMNATEKALCETTMNEAADILDKLRGLDSVLRDLDNKKVIKILTKFNEEMSKLEDLRQKCAESCSVLPVSAKLRTKLQDPELNEEFRVFFNDKYISFNLSYFNLHGINLQGADLERVNLQGANLQGVNFKGTWIDENSTVLYMSRFLLSDLDSNLSNLCIWDSKNKKHITLTFKDMGDNKMRKYLENRGALFFDENGKLVTKNTDAAKEYRKHHKEDLTTPTTPSVSPPLLPVAPSPGTQDEIIKALKEQQRDLIEQIKKFLAEPIPQKEVLSLPFNAPYFKLIDDITSILAPLSTLSKDKKVKKKARTELLEQARVELSKLINNPELVEKLLARKQTFSSEKKLNKKVSDFLKKNFESLRAA
jgi:hypothetical protein